MVEPATHGFALFGEDFGYPPGGFCVSVFLFVRHEGRVLVGRMRDDPRWAREWNPNLEHYDRRMRAQAFAALRFPGTYLREGEAVDAAAQRVARDQLGLQPEVALGAPRVVSEAGPSRRSPGFNHWDLVFLYAVDAAPPERPPAHWEALELRAPESLRPEEFAMLHGELVPLARETFAERGVAF